MTTTAEALQFVICVNAEGLDDLDLWKVYRVLPDAKASEVGCLRVVDESGEDYLYPLSRFAPLELPAEVRQLLLAAASEQGR